MDNLTHSLIGAIIGQAGLKRRTGLAMPALIIAANIPDIDASCVIYGTQSLAMRRGLTHGPLAMLILPLVLAGLLVAYDRWQGGRGRRPARRLPVRPGWLVVLCYIGTLTHPAFDWMNSYGIRLLEPFSHRWFYGDALFIIDLWIWLMLGLGLWLSRRREKAGQGSWTTPARAAIVATIAYVALNLGISSRASDAVLTDAPYPYIAVANPVPLAFWRRDILWRTGDRYGTVEWSLFGGSARAELPGEAIGMDDARIWQWAQRSADARAFLFWSRMPVARATDGRIILSDQRFLDGPAGGSFHVTLEPQP